MMNAKRGVSHPSCDRHVLVMVYRNEELVGQRILDIAGVGHRPLAKELAYRAVASDPGLAGRPWQLGVRLEGVDSDKPYVCCEARLTDRPDPPLAVLPVPVNHFAWVGISIARELELEEYTVHVAVPPSDHPLVEQSLAWEDDDFAVSLDSEPELELPREFSTAPLGPRQVIRRVDGGTWLKCVFEPGAWTAFLAAAAAEREVERGWLAAVRLHLAEGACLVVVEELFELPAEHGEFYLHTQGRQFLRLRHELGPRLGGYLHLHPREVKGTALRPSPSGPDATAAWNVEAAGSRLSVFPIAMFGACPETCQDEVAAHGFRSGVIKEIDLEVLS
jgi:hypothetical protein